MAGVVGEQDAGAGAAGQGVGGQDARDRCGDRDGVPGAADLTGSVLVLAVAGEGVEVHDHPDLAAHHPDRAALPRRGGRR